MRTSRRGNGGEVLKRRWEELNLKDGQEERKLEYGGKRRVAYSTGSPEYEDGRRGQKLDRRRGY